MEARVAWDDEEQSDSDTFDQSRSLKEFVAALTLNLHPLSQLQQWAVMIEC